MRTARRVLVLVVPGVLLACSSPPPASSPTPSPTTSAVAAALPGTSTIQTCEEGFRVWVEGSRALNDPGVDLADRLVGLEFIQRRVFQLCTLAEAERLNREIPLELAPGVSKPLIEPDFTTFAEIECVDEGPLLEGTALCAEVSP
jgi:hypothetical protein